MKVAEEEVLLSKPVLEVLLVRTVENVVDVIHYTSLIICALSIFLDPHGLEKHHGIGQSPKELSHECGAAAWERAEGEDPQGPLVSHLVEALGIDVSIKGDAVLNLVILVINKYRDICWDKRRGKVYVD